MTLRFARARTLGACATLLLASCMMNGPSRVAQGQLYTPGSAAYDAYFRDVHAQQVEASSWGDDKKGAHRSLVGSLQLTPDAPDVTIVQAAHEAASKLAKGAGSVRLDVEGTSAHVISTGNTGDGGALFRAIEDTAHLELERAKRLHGVEPRLDALTKQGNDLTARTKEDFAKRGINKETEVAGELSASLSVVARLKSRAQSEARESEDFVADLERALETASEEKAQKREATKKKSDKKDEKSERSERKEEKREEKKTDRRDDASSSPKPKPSDTPAPAPKPAPPPKPADTGEVFTP